MLKQFEDKMQKSLDSMANDFMTIMELQLL